MKCLFIKKSALLFLAAMIAVAAIASYALGSTGAYAVFYNGTIRKLPIYSVEKEEKKVAITFDAAWGTEHTDQILSNLAALNVRATFFLVEFWSEKYPDYIKKIDEAGHEIGTHSASHSQMSKMSAEDIAAELKTSSEAIEKVTGKKVELFRAPYGDYDDLLVETAQKMGLYTIQWDVDSLDWKDLSAKDMAERVIQRVKNGSIILCHNNGKHTAEGAALIIAALQNKGYEFVPVGELIYRENYTIDASGVQKAAPKE